MSQRASIKKNKYASEEIGDSAAFYELLKISAKQHNIDQEEYDTLIRQLKQKVDFREPPLKKFEQLVNDGKVDEFFT